MNKNELLTLLILRGNEAFTSVSAMTICEMIEGDMQQMKPNSLYKILQGLKSEGLVGNGMKDGRAATYYITKAGIDRIGEFE